MLSASLTERFDRPGREFAPTPLWWWSGDEVTSERLRWQMETFNAGGIHNLVVINLAPRGPLFGAMADRPAWFSEAWWERFLETCEIAERLGMRIWFYDQLGFSGANLPGLITREHPWARGRQLERKPLAATSLADLEPDEFVGAFDGAGGRFALEDLPQAQRRGAQIDVVTAPPTSFDYLNPAACRLLFDRVHGEFERRAGRYLGGVIAGSFQDELPAMNTWTDALPDRFWDRHGYDLLDQLPALYSRGDDRLAKIRSDFSAVRTELAEAAFFRPLADWHERHGLLLGCDQASPARGGYPTQATQLYCDYFRTHRWYSAAGSDHMGDSKVHSSMAHLYGHPRVWLEAFHSSGWGGTLEETYDWLIPFIMSGANLYNPHATYFGTYGGWFEWAPPSTDWRQPYWELYPEFSAAVARLCSVAVWGDFVCDVAVLHPSAVTQALVTLDARVATLGDTRLGDDFVEVDDAQETYLALCGQNNWFNPRLGALDAAAVAFDVVDDNSLQGAALEAGRLAVRNQRYGAVVLPSAVVLEEATARALIALLDKGGAVISVGRAPRLAAGASGDDALVRALAAHAQLTRVDGAAQAAALLASAQTGPRSDVPLFLRRSGSEVVAVTPGAYPSASRVSGRNAARGVSIDFDRARYVRQRRIDVDRPVAEAEVWDPATGRRRPAPIESNGAGSTIIADLDGAPVVVVAWREGQPATETLGEGRASARRLELDGWTGELVPTLDNRWGDLARPPGASIDALQIWSMAWAESEDVSPPASGWTTAKATWGQEVLTLGPVSVGEAPPPLSAKEIDSVLKGAQPLGRAAAGWTSQVYSASRGPERESGFLGAKALIDEEFVRTRSSGPGEVVVIRALVAGPAAAPAELVLGASAAKRAWWNGREVQCGADYVSVSPVDVVDGANLLELQLGENENTETAFGSATKRGALGSFFAVSRPGAFPQPPSMIRPRERLGAAAKVSFRRAFAADADLGGARLIVGAAATVEILVDDALVATQPQSEWYKEFIGTAPSYLEHDLSAFLGPGPHTLELRLSSRPRADYVIADLMLQYPGGAVAIPTDAAWVIHDGEDQPVEAVRGRYGEMASARAAARPHPLPGATWLRGEPDVGSPTLPIEVAVRARPARQWFRMLLPAGAVAVDLPTKLPGKVRIDGAVVTSTPSGVSFGAPLPRPTELTLSTDPTVFMRGGAAWSGPAIVRTVEAPIALGDWRELGLTAWSGGVVYRRQVDPEGLRGSLVLDLGDVRGAVTVCVDGERVGGAFCAPFRFDLGERSSPFELAVTVYNTLAPFLHESTPTTWAYAGQLSSGLFGPVMLEGTG